MNDSKKSGKAPSKDDTLEGFLNSAVEDGAEPVVLEPYSEDVSAGKNTYTYDAHPYHTKVPPQGIVPVIRHYTRPGDVVLDPFCGSGMTGVAAGSIGRRSVLMDLSPAATFIAYNFVTRTNPDQFWNRILEIMSEVEEENLHLYGTHCRECKTLVPSKYTVWSYKVLCSYCGHEFVLWDVARDVGRTVRDSKIKSEVECPECLSTLRKSGLKRTVDVPVEIGYHCCGSRLKESTDPPDDYDLNKIQSLEREGIPEDLWVPRNQLSEGVNTRQAINHGLDRVDKLYSIRNLRALARLWHIASKEPEEQLRQKLLFTVTSLYKRVMKLSEFRFWGGSGNNPNYNIPYIWNEQNVFTTFQRKAKTVLDHLNDPLSTSHAESRVSTQSATDLSNVPSNSIDYVFTDPPFGGTINYSEMNILWESWLGDFTDTTDEAIVNKVQGKTEVEFENLMTAALVELKRVLKPGCWMTLMFHNRSMKVWGALYSALENAGFDVSKVQVFNKKHETWKQITNDGVVGYDLMVHCQKQEERASNNKRVPDSSSTRELAQIVEDYLLDLSIGNLQDRTERMIHSRIVATLLAKGTKVSFDFAELQAILRAHFERVGDSWFTPDQVPTSAALTQQPELF